MLAAKELLAAVAGIPANQQRLIFGGVPLEDERMMFEYGVSNDAVMHVCVAIVLMKLSGAKVGSRGTSL